MKRALLLFACIILFGCSKAPGAKETGFDGIPWGADAQTVAKKLGVTPHTTSADSLFSSYYKVAIPKLSALMEKGFAKFLTGKSSTSLSGTYVLKDLTMLNQGKDGYSLFFNGKFGMNLSPISKSEYKADHKRFMKRYGVIDKKVDFIPGEYQSAYFIMWHNADGKILLAKEVYQAGPEDEVTAYQVIHMDRNIFSKLVMSAK